MIRTDAAEAATLDDDAVLEARARGYERWRMLEADEADGGEVLVERWPSQPGRARAAAEAAAWLHGRGQGAGPGPGPGPGPGQRGALAAEVLRCHGDTLVSRLPPGADAGAPLHRLEAAAVVSTLGAALRELHGLPTSGLSPRRTLGDLVAMAGNRVAAGQVATADVRAPYARFGPERLLSLARSALEGAAGDEEPVVSHGACSIDHLYLHDGRPTAWLRLDALAVSDRHLDLARLAKEVAERIGPEAVPLLFDAYGAAPDVARLDALALLDELLP